MLSNMIRPQRLIFDSDIFYVACDMITNTYYICYKYLLMIDIDFYKNEKNNYDIFDGCNKSCWKLYKSRNGIHAFLVSKKIEYNTDKAITKLLKYGSDFYYTIYCYLRGFCVRLNRKKNEDEITYTFIKYAGNTDLINDKLNKLVNIHIEFIDLFKNDGYSYIRGD